MAYSSCHRCPHKTQCIIACTPHSGLVSMPFCAIPLHNLQLKYFICFQSFFGLLLAEVYTHIVITPFRVIYNTLVGNFINKEPWWPTQKYLTRLQLFTTAVNSSAQFSFSLYIHACVYHLTVTKWNCSVYG